MACAIASDSTSTAIVSLSLATAATILSQTSWFWCRLGQNRRSAACCTTLFLGPAVSLTLSYPVDDLAILFVVDDELRRLIFDEVVTVNSNVVPSHGTFGPVELFAELTGPTLLCHQVLHVLSRQCTNRQLACNICPTTYGVRAWVFVTTYPNRVVFTRRLAS